MRLPRVRFTVGWMLVAVGSAALAGALLVVEHRHSVREANLKEQLVIARALPSAHTKMRTLLGDMGIVILGEVRVAEVLRVTGSFRASATPGSLPASGSYPVAATGEFLSEPFLRQLAGVLLDAHNYVYLSNCDFSDPRFGVRLRRGKETLDILFCLDTGHLDVWAFLRDDRGEIAHGNQGYVCFFGVTMKRLVKEALVK
jgi:hypothetical protein